MVFSDPVFLFAFLPACLLLYWAGAWRVRNVFLIGIGTTFYIWGGQAFVLLLGASILFNYFSARTLARWRLNRRAAGRRLVTITVAANLLSIAVWKYGGFAVDQFSNMLEAFGLQAGWSLQVALPIAISFYTFQCISYVVDVWRGAAQPAPRLVDFAAYIVLFPHLIAGPIVRYTDIEHDLLTRPKRRFDDFAEGMPRFFWGLSKKVLIADQVGAIADVAFALPDNRVTSGVAWLGALAYAVQIYFDFSGYSDMAIGLARVLGFHFPENFNRPYSALSVTDFWRRWHISLSTWFRDYVYIPLGGNRNGPSRTYVNLSIVFLLTGLWHGANWTFILWGGFHGACLIVERLAGWGVTTPTRFTAARRLITFALICLGWALFRAQDLDQGLNFISSMVVPNGLELPVPMHEVLTTQRIAWFALGLSIVFLPADVPLGSLISYRDDRVGNGIRMAVVSLAAPLSCLYALSSTFSPFLYFQF
ncbi:MAG: MBOAT family protein [Actinomycetota bacterium]|nr:MBOAT family protein [Actinomycetota bacterium]